MSQNPQIFLIDGSSYLYRAFHAMPPLTTSKGLPTGAIKGVANMLRNIKNNFPDAPIITIFDAKGKNFRHEILESYKANRPPMPDELIKQLDPLKKICNYMGAPVVEISGVEADDVIATLASELKSKHTVIISSLDKDLMQLVEDEKVLMMNTMTDETFDSKKVREKFGVGPEQIIEYLALVGDSSDNIPGVPKVGPKTASKWLTEYLNLENLINKSSELKGAVGESFRDSISDLERNIELVTLKKDVPLEKSISELVSFEPDNKALEKIYEELEFNAWINNQNTKTRNFKDANYETIINKKSLDDLIKKINASSAFAIDTETDSLDTKIAKLIGISVSVKTEEGYYIPIAHDYDESPDQLDLNKELQGFRKAIEQNQHKLVGQNLKYDLPVLKNHGFTIDNFLADTMIMSYVFNSVGSRHGLDNLAKNYLDYETIKYDEITGTGKNKISFSKVNIDLATNYAAEDADVTLRLYEFFSPKIRSEKKLESLLNDLEYPVLKVLLAMENNGVKIDQKMLVDYSKELSKRLEKLVNKAFSLSGEEFNLDSPKQLLEILFNKLNLPVLKKTPKGQPSTNEETLQKLAEDYELPSVILEYRGLAKLKSTYTDSLVNMIHTNTARVHTSYQQAVTSTGRLSSTEPNLQNIPIKTEEGRKIRQAFIAENDSCIISADYSQIELRIMAHLSKDTNLNAAFTDGKDVHSATAAEIFEVDINNVTGDQRRKAKAINFGLMYGMTAFGLTRQLGISRNDAQMYLDSYFSKYDGVSKYMNEIREQARKKHYVETIFGRRVHVPEINSGNGLRKKAAERAAINGPLQGSAADIIKKAMLDVNQWIQENSSIKMIMQVHDELVFEVDENFKDSCCKSIKEIMEKAVTLDVPLVVDINHGNNWDEAH